MFESKPYDNKKKKDADMDESRKQVTAMFSRMKRVLADLLTGAYIMFSSLRSDSFHHIIFFFSVQILSLVLCTHDKGFNLKNR